jgi:hypothetical protein
VINEYAKVNNIFVVYFSDGDSFLFVNARDAFLQRSHCDAVLNVEAQHGDLHWVAAGESSLWTKAALQEFVSFVFQIYTKDKKVLLRKLLNKTCVVDMSILWLWWVAHFEIPSFRAGRPWSMSPELLLQHRSIADHRAKFDHAFLATKSLNLPTVNQSFELCNGMDVITYSSSSMPKRNVFDHMHGWMQGINFRLGAGQNESGYKNSYFFLISPLSLILRLFSYIMNTRNSIHNGLLSVEWRHTRKSKYDSCSSASIRKIIF